MTADRAPVGGICIAYGTPQWDWAADAIDQLKTLHDTIHASEPGCPFVRVDIETTIDRLLDGITQAQVAYLLYQLAHHGIGTPDTGS